MRTHTLKQCSIERAALPLTMAAVIALASGAARLAVADVTFFGSVSPDPPGDGDVEATLVVGLEGDDVVDTRGYVRIDGGTQLVYNGLTLGEDEEHFGQLSIVGSLTPGGQTSLTLDGSGGISTQTVQVGREGTGELVIESGGSLILDDVSSDLTIGGLESGVGTMTVRGAFSLAVIPDRHFVGEHGLGRMEILDGGVVQTTDLSNSAQIGVTATGVGEVVVDGAGSTWLINDDLVVGDMGLGTLSVSNHGLIDNDRFGSVATIGRTGRLELNEGTYSGATIALDGYLGGSGLVRGEVDASVDAVIEATEEGRLRFTGAVVNQGSMQIRSGEADFLSTLTNPAAGDFASPGRLTLEEGVLRLAEPLTNDGVIAAVAGTNHLHGAIANGIDGSVVVASDAVAVFYDAFDVGEGSLELLEGANALFLTDLLFNEGSAAALELNGAPETPAQIQVRSEASLAGALQVELAAGFTPEVGESFELLLAAGGIDGTFDAVDLPTLPTGLAWDLSYQGGSVALAVFAALTADFNSDGEVDGLDLGRWESSFGMDDGADANGDGESDGTDFLAWQRQFGSGGSTIASAGVPEPSAAAVLLVLAGLYFCASQLTRGARREGLDG